MYNPLLLLFFMFTPICHKIPDSCDPSGILCFSFYCLLLIFGKWNKWSFTTFCNNIFNFELYNFHIRCFISFLHIFSLPFVFNCSAIHATITKLNSISTLVIFACTLSTICVLTKCLN